MGQPQFFYASITAVTFGKLFRMFGATFSLPPPIAESGFRETCEVSLMLPFSIA